MYKVVDYHTGREYKEFKTSDEAYMHLRDIKFETKHAIQKPHLSVVPAEYIWLNKESQGHVWAPRRGPS